MTYTPRLALLLFLSVFSGAVCAGFGPARLTEIATANDQAGYTTSISSPQVAIGPSGDGKVIWFRQDSMLENDRYVLQTTQVIARDISSGNVLGEPYVIAEHTGNVGMIMSNVFLSAENGNAILHYTFFPPDDADNRDKEAWSVYYDAASGWHNPAKLGYVDSIFVLNEFLTRDGVAYATVRQGNDNHTLYKYTGDESWQVLQTDIVASQQLGVGANGRIYRIHRGTTDQTRGNLYISFYTESTNSWSTSIELSEAGNGRLLRDVLVGRDGDVFSVEQILEANTDNLKLVVRKYDADLGLWPSSSDVLTLSVDGIGRDPTLYNVHFIDSRDEQAQLIATVKFEEQGKLGVWKTIHYSEQNGWLDTRVLLDLNDSSQKSTRSVSAVTTVLIQTNDNSGALAMLCANGCKDIYAKTFDASTGWSDEVYLPGLSGDTGHGCTVTGANLQLVSPLVALNDNGQVIAASGLSKYGSGLKLEYHMATVTGDILSATSDNTCMQGTGNTGGATGGTSGGQTGGTPISGDTGSSAGTSDGGSSSSGAMSWWWMLLAAFGVLARRGVCKIRRVRSV